MPICVSFAGAMTLFRTLYSFIQATYCCIIFESHFRRGMLWACAYLLLPLFYCDARLVCFVAFLLNLSWPFSSHLFSPRCSTTPSTATTTVTLPPFTIIAIAVATHPVKDVIHTMDVLLPHRLTSLISSIPFTILTCSFFFLCAII